MALLQGSDSHSDPDLERSDVDALPFRRSSVVLAGVFGSAVCGTLCLGLGVWQLLHPSPPVPPRPPAYSMATPTTSSLLPWNLPKFVDFEPRGFVGGAHYKEYELGLSMDFPAKSNWITDNFRVEVSEEAISMSKESESVSPPQKGEGLSGLTSFYRASTRAHGYSFDRPSFVAVRDGFHDQRYYEDIIFTLGEVRSMRRKSITDLSALKLPTEQRELLVKSPSDFVASYGRYFISEIIYGLGFEAQCIIDRKSVDPSVIDSQDVFAKRPRFSCRDLSTNSYEVGDSLIPDQTNVEEDYSKWKRRMDLGDVSESKMKPLRIAVRPFADIPEIAEILQGLPVAQRALFEVPRIASTTAALLIDDRAKVDCVISAYRALPPGCDDEDFLPNILSFRASSYRDRLAHVDLPARQVEFDQGDFSWLEGDALLASLKTLQEKCSP